MYKFNLKDRVTVFSKNASGQVAYIGKTHFSEGEWIGIILDEAKGRNNGCVDGHSYFNCPENYGIFVRSNQVEKEVSNEDSKIMSTKIYNANNSCRNWTTKRNRFHDTVTAPNKCKSRMTTKQQIHPRNTTKNDGEKTMKTKPEGLSHIIVPEQEAEKNVLDPEFGSITEESDKRSMTENNLSKSLAMAQKEIAVLKRKLNNSERKLELSEAGRNKLDKSIEQLREITESAVVEKEIAEEKCENFEALVKEEAHKCKALEIEMEIMKEEMQLQCINGMPTKHVVKILENRNKVLYFALQKLKDLYQGLQQQLREYRITTENKSHEIRCLKEIEKSKGQIISKCEEEVAELYSTINDMIDADEVVFEVTEQNLKLEATINDLYRQLNYADDELEISDAVQETLSEIKSICNEEIEYLESKVKRTQVALEQQVLLHKSNEEVINKYRELTAVLRERNFKLSDELERVLKERKEAVVAAENLKLKIHQEKKKNLTDIIQVESMKYDLESFKEELNFWSSFMPENFFVEGRENLAIQVKLITSKIIKKLGLIIKLLKVSYPKYDIKKKEDMKCLTSKTRFLIFASQLQGVLKIYNKSFDFTDTEHFLASGKYYSVLTRKEEEVENYLALLCKDEIDTENCLDSIRETVCSLTQLLEHKYIPISMQTVINLECYLNIILISCKCIMFYCLLLENFDGIAPEYKNSIKQFATMVKKLKIYSQSILICTKNSDKEKLGFHPIVEKIVKHDWQLTANSMDNLISFYQFLCTENKESCCDRNNLEKISLNSISCNLTQIEMDLECLWKALNSGEFLVEREMVSVTESPIFRWAQKKKEEEEERKRNFKNKIASCELEIFDLSQSLLEKKKHVDLISSKTFKNAGNQTEELQSKFESGDCSSVTSDFLRLKLQDMESSIKYLSQKNFELRVAPLKRHLNILTPLKVLPRPRYSPEVHDICVMQKKLNKLSLDLRRFLVPLVVDITKKSSCKRRKYKKYLIERIQMCREIEEELWLIKIEIRKMRKSSRCIWSNTNPFPLQNV